MDFDLSLPTESEVKEQIVQEIAPTANEVAAIEASVQAKRDQVMQIDLTSEEQRREMTKVFENFGMDVLKQSEKKNSFMQRQLMEIGEQGGESGTVAQSLGDLAIQMRDLDPSMIDFAKKGPLGKLFNPARKYFEKYKRFYIYQQVLVPI